MDGEPKEESNQETRYPVLEIIAFTYQALAVLVIVGALVITANIYFKADVFDTQVAFSMLIVFVIGIIGFVILCSLAEFINIFIHIEENTRKTADLLQMQIEMRNKN